MLSWKRRNFLMMRVAYKRKATMSRVCDSVEMGDDDDDHKTEDDTESE